MLLFVHRGAMEQGWQRSLIFYIGDIGFLLNYSYIVEVLGVVSDSLDFSRSDLANNIVASLEFRHTLIPVFDPFAFIGEASRLKIRERTIIILHGTEGNWALVVDTVDTLTDQEAVMPCSVPDLLKLSSRGCFSELRLIANRPYVVFEPENFYGAVND